MSTRDSTLFTLNEVATEIWQAADGRTPLADIIRRGVCSKFETGPDMAYSASEAFCREMARHGILLVSDQPIPTGS
ncbi:MAG: PqqD family protein [Bryobacteraceae bacterium]